MKEGFFIIVTLLVAMMLTILPLPPAIVWFRPSWTLMVLIFWLMVVPHRLGIGIAFIVGIILDLLTGTILGQHALVLTLVAYIVVRFHKQIRVLPLWQQMLLVMFFTLIYLALQYWMMALSGMTLDAGRYWLPIVTTTLFWPWIYLLLNDYQHRFEIN